MPHITLEQWQALIAVVEADGYAQAAEKLSKSQSAITYAVKKIESLLGVTAFAIHGRKAVLTPTGQMLYRRALALMDTANGMERAAHRLSAGWEAVITIAAEVLLPMPLLLTCLEQFGQDSPHTRIELIESVLGGTSEALLNGGVDLAIAPQLPPGFLGDLLLRVQLVAVAQAAHPLHQLGRELSPVDLAAHRHVVVRDSGGKRDQRVQTIDVNQRWTVSNVATSIQAVSQGYGFAWLPVLQIQDELRAGVLKPLPLREGGVREIPLYLIMANPEMAGPGVSHLKELLIAAVSQ